MVNKEYVSNNLLDSLGRLKPKSSEKTNLSIQEIYNIYHEIKTPICPYCNKEKKFKTFNKGYWDTCNTRKCVIKNKKEDFHISKENYKKLINSKGLINQKMLRKYNFDIKELYDIAYGSKRCIMCKEELPFRNFSLGYSSVCKKKCKKSSLIIFKKKEKTKEDIQKIIEKRKKTNKERYNHTNYLCSSEGRKKTKESKLLRYNNENYNNPTKNKETCLSRYGSTTFLNSKEQLALRKEKYLKKYPNISNLNRVFIESNILENNKLNKIKFKEYFKCGNYFMYTNLRKLNVKYKSVKSQEEYNIALHIKNSIINTRSIIAPLELDIYSKKHNLAIEYNGLMWHSFGYSESKLFNNFIADSNKHLNKTILCEEKGIQLFHIFEDEWLDKNKKHIWISMIRDKQGLNHRIYARKTEVKEVSTKDARFFVNENHMQGYVNASIKLGLYHNNVLVSIMTFGKPRYNKDVEYELLRFCTKKNLTIVGGGSKLLKAFERRYKPKSLLSYANRRWSTGNFYEQVGFKFLRNTTPNYFYFKPVEYKLYSRNKFQKHKLRNILKNYNNSLTEKENMLNNGYRIIYDSGNKVYIKEY